MNFVQVCAEMVWDFWLHGNETFSWLWLYLYHPTFKTVCKWKL